MENNIYNRIASIDLECADYSVKSKQPSRVIFGPKRLEKETTPPPIPGLYRRLADAPSSFEGEDFSPGEHLGPRMVREKNFDPAVIKELSEVPEVLRTLRSLRASDCSEAGAAPTVSNRQACSIGRGQ